MIYNWAENSRERTPSPDMFFFFLRILTMTDERGWLTRFFFIFLLLCNFSIFFRFLAFFCFVLFFIVIWFFGYRSGSGSARLGVKLLLKCLQSIQCQYYLVFGVVFIKTVPLQSFEQLHIPYISVTLFLFVCLFNHFSLFLYFSTIYPLS